MVSRRSPRRQTRMSTSNILIEFMNKHFRQKGFDWTYQPEEHEEPNAKSCPKSSREVSQVLFDISNEVQEFIRHNSYNDGLNDKLNEITAILFPKNRSNNNNNDGEKDKSFEDDDIDNTPTYETFKSLPDGLFSPTIGWFQIVTFLAFGADLACKAIEEFDEDLEGRHEMVSRIITWISRYIDEELLQWIDEQEGGWLSIKDLQIDVADKINSKTVGVRHYISMAAFVAIASGIYICSKFTSQ